MSVDKALGRDKRELTEFILDDNVDLENKVFRLITFHYQQHYQHIPMNLAKALVLSATDQQYISAEKLIDLCIKQEDEAM